MERSVIALLHGPDQPGIVAKVAGWIHEHGGNVLHADQHLDRQENIFFQRVEWSPQLSRDLRSEADAFSSFAHQDLGMKVRIALSDDQPKIALMVSRADHCFHDLVLRVRSGEWNAKIVGVVSNHQEMRTASEAYGLDYLHLPVTKDSKKAVEEEQLAWLNSQGVELVILARYMQVLSSDFLDRVGCPVINIHHSFLPSFAGAKPYHQAYQRGVKLIGATAHYVTEDLDEGPIIEQNVVRVDHSQSVSELVRVGQDEESRTLAQAVSWFAEHRILMDGIRTIIFR